MPTLSTAAIDGVAMSANAAMLPGWRADISSTRKSVDSVARSTVHGWPSSLLNDPGGAITSPSGASTAAMRSFVEVLPDDPVSPMMVSLPAANRAATALANRASAASTAAPEPSASCSRTPAPTSAAPGCAAGSTTMAGTPTGRAARTATAPASTAAAAKSWPSLRAPGSARNSPPGVTARESNSTVPVTRVRAAASGVMSARRPPTMSATSVNVNAITGVLPTSSEPPAHG